MLVQRGWVFSIQPSILPQQNNITPPAVTTFSEGLRPSMGLRTCNTERVESRFTP